MPQPPTYNRQFSFQNQQSLTPADPLPADELDSELNSIKLTLDATLANLGLIQRDDGELGNETVGVDQLKPELAFVGTDITEIGAARDDAVLAADAAEASEIIASAAAATATGAANTAQASVSDASNAAIAAQAADSTAQTAKIDAETAAFNAQISEANAATSTADSAAQAAKLIGTSVTSNTIGVGSLTFETQADKFFSPGNWLQITSDAAPTLDRISGLVTSYTDTTLVVDSQKTHGSGTHTDWTIHVSGAIGIDGVIGADGTTTLSGSGAPGAGLGADGDFYIDTAVYDIYGPKTGGVWGAGTSLIGAAGADGTTTLSGSGAPGAGLGVDGDFYIDTAVYDIYGPKTGGAWGSGMSLVGPSGAGTGDVIGPATNTNGYLPQWDGANSKTLKNGIDPTSIVYTSGIGSTVQGYDALLADIAGISFSQGDVIYHDGSNLVRLAAGTDGYALTTHGAGANPTWAAVAAGGDLDFGLVTGGNDDSNDYGSVA